MGQVTDIIADNIYISLFLVATAFNTAANKFILKEDLKISLAVGAGFGLFTATAAKITEKCLL